jgi:hypothetical protein
MLIANPISDTAFKYLMSDARIARFFLETILDEQITDVVFKPQELTYDKAVEPSSLAASLAVFRLDFVATIKTADNRYKKVLIEIQKARRYADIMRFRNYLGEHYKKQDEITTPTGTETVILPILTIYILGFRLKEIDTPLTKIVRRYVDQIAGVELTEKSEFVEMLTHDSYVVQVPRIGDKMQTRVEKLLSFFEQKYFVDSDGMVKEYPHPVEGGDMQLIAETLHHMGTDPERRKWLDTEREAYRTYYVELEGIEKELAESQQLLQHQAEAIAATQKELQIKQQEADQERKARIDKEAQLSAKEQEADQERKARLEKEAQLLEKDRENERLLRELEELKKRWNNN